MIEEKKETEGENENPQAGAVYMPTLPAKRGLSKLADMRPAVIIDTREQEPLPISWLPSRRLTLTTGDYSFVGGETQLAIERKSIADLVGCCKGDQRDRFERELHRLRGFAFRRLLVIGSREEIEQGLYRSAIEPKSVLGTLNMIEARYDVPVVFAATPANAARLVERWVWWFARELVEDANALLIANRNASEEAAQ